MDSKNLQQNFLENLAPKHCVICQVGVRFSGKSLLSMSLLKEVMERNIYDEFHLVLPSYRFQARNTYGWFTGLPDKIQSKITIYEDFSLVAVSRLLDRAKTETKRKHRYLFLDDATSFSEFFGQSEVLKELVSMCRHYFLTLHVITHGLKSVLNPVFRQNVSFFVLHRNLNAKFLESLWEESMSLFYTKAEWFELCKREMKKAYPAILINRDTQDIDIAMMEWPFVKKQRELIIKSMNRPIKQIIDVNDDKETCSNRGCGRENCKNRQ